MPLGDRVEVRDDSGLLAERLLDARSSHEETLGRLALSVDGKLARILVAGDGHCSKSAARSAISSPTGRGRIGCFAL